MTLLSGLRTRLARVTSSGSFIPEVDGLRFIAIGWVLAFHINGELMKVHGSRYAGQLQSNNFVAVVDTWNFGVQLFFAISGFILGLPFLRHYWQGTPKPSLRTYYWRRLTRIEPPLVINLCIFLALLVMVKGGAMLQLLPHFLASLFYSHNLIYGEPSAINFVTWSLEIEAQFYLLMPCLAFVFRPRTPVLRWLCLGGATLLAAVANAWLAPRHPLLSLTLPGQIQYFLAGFLLAGWYSQSAEPNARRSWAWDWAAVGGWLTIQTCLLHRSDPLSATVVPFAIALSYAAMFRGRCANRLITLPALTVIGGMCYTIYLYHPYLKSAFKRFTFTFQWTGTFWVNSAFQILFLGGIIVAVCGVLFLLFEKPFMYRSWPQAVWHRLRGTPPSDVRKGPSSAANTQRT